MKYQGLSDEERRRYLKICSIEYASTIKWHNSL